jgi:hypothetical protein
MTQTGRCLCGGITYEITGDLIATAVCHCDHCQRQSGGAFSVNLIVHESQLTVSGELSTFEDRVNTATPSTFTDDSAVSADRRSTPAS